MLIKRLFVYAQSEDSKNTSNFHCVSRNSVTYPSTNITYRFWYCKAEVWSGCIIYQKITNITLSL